MMSRISRIFLRGLFAALPIALSIYVLVWFFSFVEALLDGLFFWIIPETRAIPGLTILLGIGIIFLLGVFLSAPLLNRAFHLLEAPFRNVPLLKSIYSAVKDLLLYFSQGGGTRESQVVVVAPPGDGPQFIGLLTRSDLSSMPPEMIREDRVAVFVPMSYALGGYTVFVPRSWIRKTNMRVETAMKSALTAWIERSTK